MIGGLILRGTGGGDPELIITRGLYPGASSGGYTPDLTLVRKKYMQIVIDGRGRLRAIDYEAVTVDNTVKTLNTAMVAAAWGCRILLELGSIRYLHHALHGTPSASVGIPLAAGQEIIIIGNDMRLLKMIRIASDSGVAHVTYLQNDAEPM